MTLVGAVVSSGLVMSTPAMAKELQGWSTYGSARVSASTTGWPISLTGGEANQAGIVLQDRVTSLAQPVQFRYRLLHSGSAKSGDGSAFVLLNARSGVPRNPLPSGGHLAISGLDGLAVVFDTFKNGDDPGDNYVSVVDMSTGLDGGWSLARSPDRVLLGEIQRNSAMDVFITVDRPSGVIEVGIARNARGPSFAKKPHVVYQFPLAPSTLDPSWGSMTLTDSVRIGFAAATGAVAGTHRVMRYWGSSKSLPVNAGLWSDWLRLQRLANQESWEECLPAVGAEVNDTRRNRKSRFMRPAATSAGNPVTTLNQTREQMRTVHITSASCRGPSPSSVAKAQCSGVLVSPDLVLTADHCTNHEIPKKSGNRFSANAYVVTVGAVVLRGSKPQSARVASTGGSCLARTLWRGRDGSDSSVSGDVALLKLTNCTQPDHLAKLGQTTIDTSLEMFSSAGPRLTYVGYPGDKSGPLGTPRGAEPGSFPEMWSIDTSGYLGKDPVEFYRRDSVLEIPEQVAGGGSGGPIFWTADGRDQALVSLAAREGSGFTRGPLITPQMCTNLWSAAVANALRPPLCRGTDGKPAMPFKVVAVPGFRSATISWEAGVGAVSGQEQYTVTASPGGLTCVTLDTTCTVAGLTGGAPYTFRVRAMGPFGESLPSYPSNEVVPEPRGATSAPTTLPVVSAGAGYTCAVTSQRGAKCWGSNSYPTLGNDVGSSYLPVDVSTLTSGVKQMSTGWGHVCAVTMTGGTKCWGRNGAGELGDGSTTWSTTPVDVVGLGSGVKQVSVGGRHTCALTDAAAVKCWGSNTYGKLGDGTETDRSTPVAVTGLASGVKAIAAGAEHTCALLDSGDVKCWGYNYRGQLGNGTDEDRRAPADVLGLGSAVTDLSASSHHTCALMISGEIKCWGENWHGQLGDGTTTHRLLPTAVVGLGKSARQVSAGDHHTCAVLQSGGAQCWGRNLHGQIGDGTRTDRLTPTPVSGLSTGAGQISSGTQHSCVTTTAPKIGVKCWGYNWRGEIGDGTVISRWTPVDVIGL